MSLLCRRSVLHVSPCGNCERNISNKAVCRAVLWKYFVLLSHYIAVSTLQLSDCTEFKLIPPEQYDRNISAIDDITKRPLGYMFGVAQNPGVQSEIKNPCVYVKNLTSRDLEVKVSQLHLYIYIMCSRVFAGTDLGVVMLKPPKLKLKSFIYLLFLTKTLVNIKGQNSLCHSCLFTEKEWRAGRGGCDMAWAKMTLIDENIFLALYKSCEGFMGPSCRHKFPCPPKFLM